MQTFDTETAPAFPSKPPTRRQRASRRFISVVSAIAAVLVIALVTTALIASHTPGKSSPTARQAAAATAAPTQPLDQTWEALPHLSNISTQTQTWLAPSDTQVVYQEAASDIEGSVSLRRSDDQGASWNDLPSPTGAALPDTTSLYISPTNAQHVLVSIGSDCPAGQAMTTGSFSPLSSGHTCSALYFSSSGGAHWTPVTLPAHGSHSLFMGYGIFAQETRLYAILVVEPGMTASELVTSSDDGATWHFSDQGLTPDQHCLQGIAGPATGTTLYVTTLNHCGNQINGTETAQIWRSNDAGAQWTAVSAIDGTSASMLWAMNVSGRSQPVLVHINPTFNKVQFSLDDGKNWQPVPALGNAGTLPFPLGILRDGSLLAQGNNGFYAWKAGDASWRQVAPAPPGKVRGAFITVDAATGHETLYAEVSPQGGNTTSFYRIDLA